MAVQDNMNLPSSGTSLSGNISKSTTFMERFNGILTKTVELTNKIAKNMSFTGGSNSAGNISTQPSGFTNSDPNAGGGVSAGGVAKGIMKAATFAIGGMSVAAEMMPGLQDTLQTQLLTSQARFSGFRGNVAGQVRAAMGAGTSNSPYDFIQAVSAGTAGGLVPGLPGYSGVLNGVSQISNLTGSGTSAMQAAVGLNQGESVNKLRMLGINVRNAQGSMRNPTDIYKDIYSLSERMAGRKLTQKDVAISLQSGNGMASLLDYAAGGNAELRSSLQTAALQYSQGGDLSKASLTETGQLTGATNAQSALNASKFGLTESASSAMSQGFIEGASNLTKFNDKLTNIIDTSKLANDALKQFAKAETLAADNVGKALINGIGLVFAAITSSAVLKNLVGKFKGEPAAIASEGVVASEGAGSITNTGKIVVDPVTGAATHVADTVASTSSKLPASTLANSGLAGKILGPIGIFATAKSLISSSKDVFSLSVLTGKRVRDPNQSILDSTLHGPRYVDANSISGNATGGLGQNAAVGGTESAVLSSPVSSAVVGVASSQIGIPYSWGGGTLTGPTLGMGRGRGTVGFDCSSLSRFVMAKFGVILPRTAHEQQRCGIQIDPRQAQPGDLLFWGTPAHHVAVYVGNGMMIQAPQTGGNVERVAVNLDGVTSCARVLDGVTGTSARGNLLGGDSSKNGSVAKGVGGVNSNTPSAGVNLFANSNTVGFSPDAAMSGGSVSGSGLGFGSSSSNFYGGSTGNMAQQYLSINSKTGSLEVSNGSSTANVINYGGVVIKVDTKGANVTPKEIGKAIKEELRTLGINTQVVNA